MYTTGVQQPPLLVHADHVVCTFCGTTPEGHSGRDRFVCKQNSINAELQVYIGERTDNSLYDVLCSQTR